MHHYASRVFFSLALLLDDTLFAGIAVASNAYIRVTAITATTTTAVAVATTAATVAQNASSTVVVTRTINTNGHRPIGWTLLRAVLGADARVDAQVLRIATEQIVQAHVL